MNNSYFGKKNKIGLTVDPKVDHTQELCDFGAAILLYVYVEHPTYLNLSSRIKK